MYSAGRRKYKVVRNEGLLTHRLNNDSFFYGHLVRHTRKIEGLKKVLWDSFPIRTYRFTRVDLYIVYLPNLHQLNATALTLVHGLLDTPYHKPTNRSWNAISINNSFEVIQDWHFVYSPSIHILNCHNISLMVLLDAPIS